MSKIACKYCGAPINGTICKYCNKEIDKSDLELLDKNLEYLKEYQSSIRNKIKNNEKLSEEEDKKFKSLLDYEMIKDEELDDYPIINSVLLQKKIMSYETFESFIKAFVTKSMRIVTKEIDEKMVNNYIGVFIEEMKGFTGKAIEHHFYIFNSETMKNLYDGDLNAFTTLFHEMYHGVNDIYIKSGKMNEVIKKTIEDEVIRNSNEYNDENDSYYKKNYKSNSREVFAQTSAINTTDFILKQLGLNAPEGFFEYQNSRFDTNLSNQNRIVTINGEEKVMALDEIFDDILKKHPELLNEYKGLSLEYINDNGIVRKKTKDELHTELDYINDENDIAYIKSLIDKKTMTN